MTTPGCEWSDRPEICEFQLWSPPSDPEKPRLPYIPGFTVSIRRHVAPPPFGHRYGPGSRKYLALNDMYNITQSELVITNPPLETEPVSPTAADTARITVTAPIAIGIRDGAQVVACTVAPDGGGKPFQAVAKIYDALYYRFSPSLVTEPRDVVMQADEDYSREVAAYEHLRNAKQTGPPNFVPEYFGSWTFDLPITYKGEPRMRPVRMILIERLDGATLRDTHILNNDIDGGTDAFHYPEEWRLEVLARAMDGFVRQQYIGVDQGDFADRNLMMVTDEGSDTEHVAGIPLPRIALLDYSNSTVSSLLTRDKMWHLDLLGPSNPLWCFWNVELHNFVGWIPDEWFERPRLMQEWLVQKFGTEEKKALYAPIQVDLKFAQDDKGPPAGTAPSAQPSSGPASCHPEAQNLPTQHPKVPGPLSNLDYQLPLDHEAHDFGFPKAGPQNKDKTLSKIGQVPAREASSYQPSPESVSSTSYGHTAIHGTSSPGKKRVAFKLSSSGSDGSDKTDRRRRSPPPSPPDVKPGRDHWNRTTTKLEMIDGSLFGDVLRRQRSEK